MPGSSDRSYGIHVAARAGVPATVLERARFLLAELESRHAQAPPAEAGAIIKRPKLIQPSLFAGSQDPVLEEINSIDLSSLDAESALALIRRWRRELGATK